MGKIMPGPLIILPPSFCLMLSPFPSGHLPTGGGLCAWRALPLNCGALKRVDAMVSPDSRGQAPHRQIGNHRLRPPSSRLGRGPRRALEREGAGESPRHPLPDRAGSAAGLPSDGARARDRRRDRLHLRRLAHPDHQVPARHLQAMARRAPRPSPRLGEALPGTLKGVTPARREKGHRR